MWLLFSVCLFFGFFGENAYILHSLQISNIQNRSINYSHHSVYYIFRTYSLDTWKFVPFDQRLPQGPENHHPILFLWVWHFFFPQIPHDTYSISLFQDITLSMMPSRLIHVVTNGRISFFYIFLICIIFYIFIYYTYIYTHTHIYICIKLEI